MIRDDIKAATIAAMKGGDKATTQTLRLVSAAIKNRDIEARTGGATKDANPLAPRELQKMIQQRPETGASSMKDMGRVMALVKERLGPAIEPARASGLVKAALS